MLKRLWIAVLLAATTALSANTFAKDKEKDKGKVEVALIAPTINASYTAPAAVPLSASAVSDQSNHPVVQVQFFQGATLLGTATQAPYTLNWINVAPGNYMLTAVATNDKGDSATSAPVRINVNAPPEVHLTAPAPGTSVPGPANIAIAAAATDSDGSIARVEFYNGAALLGTATSAPYMFNWNGVVPGNYTITARAIDNQGTATTSAAVGINVNAIPVVSLATPAGNASYISPATITLSANAVDSDGSIAKVEFFNGATLLGVATSAPYTFAWNNVAAGNYTLTAKATDNQGATANSAAVAVNVNAPPRISLTAPANNSIVTSPASITLTAAATDSDGSIAKVEFFNGATLLGTATSAPYTFTWTNLAAGNYTLSARATDNQGATATSTAINISVNTPPTVALTTPAANASYISPAMITLAAAATDSDGSIAKVEFFQGSSLLGTAVNAPYSIQWPNVAPGTYLLSARATDNQGGTAVSAPVAITVAANKLPTVALTLPVESQRFTAPANVILEANAADSDGTVAKVEFYQGNTLLATLTEGPYLYHWEKVAAGNYALTAKVTDNLGGATSSAPVNITVVANTLPSVALTATPANAAAPATIRLEATATDADGTIAKVEFFNGGALLGTATGAPYRFDWNGVGAGEYLVTAQATDNLGGTAQSAVVTVKVSNNVAQAYFIYADHLNTPRLITDGTNQIVWQWDNGDAFGNNVPTASAGFEFNLRFPGQYFDKETNLHYNYFRDYDPQTGRYIESDPIGLAAGPNTYAYVEGNPLSKVDPEGLQACMMTPAGPICTILPPPRILPPPGGYPPGIEYPANNPLDGTRTETRSPAFCPPEGPDCSRIRQENYARCDRLFKPSFLLLGRLACYAVADHAYRRCKKGNQDQSDGRNHDDFNHPEGGYFGH